LVVKRIKIKGACMKEDNRVEKFLKTFEDKLIPCNKHRECDNVCKIVNDCKLLDHFVKINAYLVKNIPALIKQVRKEAVEEYDKKFDLKNALLILDGYVKRDCKGKGNFSEAREKALKELEE
jgi:hypothetical protein